MSPTYSGPIYFIHSMYDLPGRQLNFPESLPLFLGRGLLGLRAYSGIRAATRSRLGNALPGVHPPLDGTARSHGRGFHLAGAGLHVQAPPHSYQGLSPFPRKYVCICMLAASIVIMAMGSHGQGQPPVLLSLEFSDSQGLGNRVWHLPGR